MCLVVTSWIELEVGAFRKHQSTVGLMDRDLGDRHLGVTSRRRIYRSKLSSLGFSGPSLSDMDHFSRCFCWTAPNVQTHLFNQTSRWLTSVTFYWEYKCSTKTREILIEHTVFVYHCDSDGDQQITVYGE